jgi:hypothetical protein
LPPVLSERVPCTSPTILGSTPISINIPTFSVEYGKRVSKTGAPLKPPTLGS